MKNRADMLRVTKIILSILEKGDMSYEALKREVLLQYRLSVEELSDFDVNSRQSVIRSMCGTAISTLLREKSITEIEGALRIAKERPIVIDEMIIENIITSMLENGAIAYNAIIDRLTEYFNVHKTKTVTDDRILRKTAGLLLSRMCERGEIVQENGKYEIAPGTDDLKTQLLSRLYRMGGEFFERYFVNLLSRHFTMQGKTVTRATVSGGSSDGGIDGIVETVDWLGFSDTVMTQMKCRRSIHVTEKEIREFYGALCAKGGSRGIFATTSTFHKGAAALLDTLDNCVGVDGQRIFEMACRTKYGIREKDGTLALDERVFNR